MLVSLIIPTRNRHQALVETIARIEAMDPADIHESGGIELIIADNNSTPPVRVPRRLINGLKVTMLRLPANRGAAARNDAALLATGEWVLMLDDDSSPLDLGFIQALRSAEPHIAAICADIHLPRAADGTIQRESGGLPEVPVGCGVAYRRELFNALGGYDPSFLYYAEEYDLAARIIAAGYHIIHDHRFLVEHRKVTSNRSLGDILHRLVLNNAIVWHRYAPDSARADMIARDLERLERIARRESQLDRYSQACTTLDNHLRDQPRTPLSQPHFDRLIGRAAIRHTIAQNIPKARSTRAQLWLPDDRPGKHADVIQQTLRASGIEPIEASSGLPDPNLPCIPGTLAAGPMLDAAHLLQHKYNHPSIILPWLPLHCSAQPSRSSRLAA